MINSLSLPRVKGLRTSNKTTLTGAITFRTFWRNVPLLFCKLERSGSGCRAFKTLNSVVRSLRPLKMFNPKDVFFFDSIQSIFALA